MNERPARWVNALWFAAFALLSSAWCLTAATELGATFDEPTYIAAGLDRWRDGGIGGLMRLGTMPLPVDAMTLPVRVAERGRDARFRIATDGRGRVTTSDDVPRVLRLARATTLVFWWLLLAAGWTLGRQVAGPWGARLAVAFLAVEPSLLAHSALATTDVAVTAFLLAFAASLGSIRERMPAASHRRWLAPAVWLGLAILSKASALVFGPLIALADFIVNDSERRWRAFAGDMGKIVAVALAIAFIYCNSDWRADESFIQWTQALPDGAIASGLRAVAERLQIFSNAGEGIVQQIKHNIRGHDTFLLGDAYERAVWFYFPVVLSIKASGAVLAGLVLLAAVRSHALVNVPLLAAGLILLCSPLFRVQTGVRMILPVLALAIVGLAAAPAWGLDNMRSMRALRLGGPRSGQARGLLRAAVIALFMWSAIGAWRVWPDGLRFANEFWGGPDEAYRLVSDSNYDWGQGLPELATWLATEQRQSIDVWYWGTDPASREAPFRLFDVRAVAPAGEDEILRLLDGRVLAVSTTLLHGSVLVDAITRAGTGDQAATRSAEGLRRVLRDRQPNARTRTFLIYEFQHTQ